MGKDDSGKIDKLIRTWKVSYDNRFYSDYRKNALLDLLATLEEEGFGEEYINSATKSKIIEACTNENSKKARAWKKVVSEELEDALVEYYPAVAEIIKYDPEKRRLKKTEHTIVPEGERREFEKAAEVEDGLEPGERMLDLAKMREGIETIPLEPDALLKELGFEDDGRSDKE